MKLARAVFRRSEMRGSSWNGDLYCETFHEEGCRCQKFKWFKGKNWLFVTEK